MIDRILLDAIIQRAKEKKDGVYSFRGYKYIKVNNDIFIGYNRTVYQCFGCFLSPVNTIENYWELEKFMKKKYKALKEQS